MKMQNDFNINIIKIYLYYYIIINDLMMKESSLADKNVVSSIGKNKSRRQCISYRY